MKISQIIDKIEDKQLFVPAFQREYVWKKQNAKDLINSLILDYPTGTMLTWETINPPELKGPHKYHQNQGSVKLILDGQQRITTLYMLITGNIPPYYTEEDIINDPRSLYINVETLELEYFKKSKMLKSPVWIGITEIFKGNVRLRDFVEKLENELPDGERISRETENRIDDNIRAIERIKEREFLEQIIPTKASIKEAIDIFYIVNASGVNLTDAELALAQISGYWPEAREKIKEKLSELEKAGWVFRLDHMIYMLLGAMHNVGSKMEKLHSIDNFPRIKDVWDKLSNDTLDYVFNIMKTQAYIDHTKEINTRLALVPIVVYAFQKGDNRMTQIEIKKAIKWFYYSQLRKRYVSSVTQKLDKDLGIIANESNPFDKLLTLIESERRLEIDKNEFVGAGISHPLWGLMKFYFRSRGAICLSTGISIRRNMGKKYELESDHIFAYSILKNAGYDWLNRQKYSLAQEVTNRVVLTQTGNRSKSATGAAEYLTDVSENFPTSLKLQSVPDNPELWKLENYESFLEARREILANQLNEYLSGITDTLNEVVDLGVEELIEMGETHHVEFKTTLRYDMRENRLNKKLEEVILKTIAAFSNRDGGTLIMGVTDDMRVVGLENDYNTLREANRDHFELHLRSLINESYGVEFASSNVDVSFPIVHDLEICVVEIKQGQKPLYTIVSDKSGNKTKKFFVRSGNSSPELPLDEIADYVQKRFG